jgi:heme/copper-type cytochrome/quinol oxidase subunit 2
VRASAADSAVVAVFLARGIEGNRSELIRYANARAATTFVRLGPLSGPGHSCGMKRKGTSRAVAVTPMKKRLAIVLAVVVLIAAALVADYQSSGGKEKPAFVMADVTHGVVAIAVSSTADALIQGGTTASQDIERRPVVRQFTIRARKYAFDPSRVEVTRGDIVRITLIAEDVAHSFTIDEYRIAKRVAPGRSVTFEFRADRPGRVVFYCSMTGDERCREMRGELTVQSIPDRRKRAASTDCDGPTSLICLARHIF